MRLDGKVYDLGVPIEPGMPVLGFHTPYSLMLRVRHRDIKRPGGTGFANEVINFSAHTGTHLDALGHFSRDGRLCDGSSAAEAEVPSGLTRLGIEQTEPIIARGLLLDVAGLAGQPFLPAGYGISADELEACLRAAGLTVQRGDVVYVRTGWMSQWRDPDTYNGLRGGYPGLAPSGGQWLAEHKVRIAASDTTAFEVAPPQGDSVHGILIVDHGIQIMENVNLEELAAAGVREFTTVILPLRLVGATASPVRPIALVE